LFNAWSLGGRRRSGIGVLEEKVKIFTGKREKLIEEV
jgi:hypothetical protein